MSKKIDWEALKDIRTQDAVNLRLCIQHPEMRQPLFAGYEGLPRGKARLKAIRAQLAEALLARGFVPPPNPQEFTDEEFLAFFEETRAKEAVG